GHDGSPGPRAGRSREAWSSRTAGDPIMARHGLRQTSRHPLVIAAVAGMRVSRSAPCGMYSGPSGMAVWARDRAAEG
ncbi:MAG: hypothetical protein ACREQ5_21400, partial [Candidatus Dormibacteria bacterium]